MQTVPEGTELTEQQPKSPQNFDPCCNAKITSPFYLYNHDSPRPSFDVTAKDQNTPGTRVSIHDVESGTFNLSPTITEEKKEAQKPASNRLKFWQKKNKCLTKPKETGWLSRLPPRQRLLVKIVIALVIIGAAVGIAVGISIRVHGGVYKDNNSTHQIG